MQLRLASLRRVLALQHYGSEYIHIQYTHHIDLINQLSQIRLVKIAESATCNTSNDIFMITI